jgi:hypothetical protein
MEATMTDTTRTPDPLLRLRPEVKEKWIAELESGRWTQGHGMLGRSNTTERCCLGVLCEVAIREGVIPPATPLTPTTGRLLYTGEANYLPVKVRKWAFDNPHGPENPVLKFTEQEIARGHAKGSASPDGKVRLTASAANDGGVPFDAIAEAIRRSL